MNQSNVGLYTKPIYIPKEETDPDKADVGHVRSGMNSKTFNIKEACPAIKLSGDPQVKCRVLFVEPLVLHQQNSLGKGGFSTNIAQLEQNPAIKVVWAEEQEFLRWCGADRQKILDMVDHFACSNQYQYNQFKSFLGDTPVSILRTPIDANFYKPDKTKKKRVVALGRICTEKNIEGVVEVFKNLPDDIEKVYLGGQRMWNEQANQVNTQLEQKVMDVVDVWEAAADREQVADELSQAWGYFNVSIYDVGCLSFLEAAMSGCHCFAWEFHPMFDEYDCVHRFFDYKEGADLMVNTLKEKGLAPDMAMRKQVSAMHNYASFNSQIKNLTAEVLFHDE